MDLSVWRAQLETAIAAALPRAASFCAGTEITRLDIGIFPWHGYVELSLLRTSDPADDRNGPTGIADWPLYNFCPIQAGKWPECTEVASEMYRLFDDDLAPLEDFLRATATAAKAPEVREQLRRLPQSADFLITVYNPDDYESPNYVA